MRDQSSRPHVGVAGMRPSLSVLDVAVTLAVICLSLLGAPCRAQGQSDAPMQSVHLELRLRVEAPLLAAGATLFVVGENLSITHKPVPPGGLDPSDIRWSFDRGAIGERSTRADSQSDYFRDAAGLSHGACVRLPAFRDAREQYSGAFAPVRRGALRRGGIIQGDA